MFRRDDALPEAVGVSSSEFRVPGLEFLSKESTNHESNSELGTRNPELETVQRELGTA
jgi:hypothetical protein